MQDNSGMLARVLVEAGGFGKMAYWGRQGKQGNPGMLAY